MKRIVPVMVLVAVAVLVLAGGLLSQEWDKSGRTMELGIAMNLWYGFEPGTGVSIGGLGSEHWNSDAIHSTGLRDSVAVRPEQGFYASDDPQVIAKQVEQIESLGVSWILTSWWGWGDDDLDGSIDNEGRKAINRAHKALFDHLKTTGSPIRVAIGMDNWMTDNFDWTQGPEEVDAVKSEMIWNYIKSNYVDEYPDNYFMWEGKPLVTSWAPHVLQSSEQFTYKTLWPVGFDHPSHQGTMDWSWVAPSVAPETYREVLISDDGFITINPRYDQFFGWSQGHLLDGEVYPVDVEEVKRDDPFLTEGLYDTNWRFVFDAKDRINLVFIATWNDYHEQTQIEPSHNGALGSGTFLMEKTRYYWSRLNNGQPFEEYEELTSQWISLSEFKSVVGNPSFSGLGYDNSAELDDFLRNLMLRAQSRVEEYLNTEYRREDIPEGVKEITLRLAGNLYHYTLKIKSGELYRVGDTEFQLIDDNVFTDSIKKDLDLWKNRGRMKVYSP